jgi:sodium-type flagellar protein MotY
LIKHLFLRFLLPCVLLQSLSLSVAAVVFRAEIDQSRWDTEMSPFICRLSQTIPRFGEAVFHHEAGEPLAFHLLPTHSQQLSGPLLLVAEAAPWQPGRAPQVIGEVRSQSGQVEVPSAQAIQMLAALQKGLLPTFSAGRWFGTPEALSISISSVNFQSAYEDYLACVAQLLPVNYRQVARTAVLFPSAEYRLSDATRERLDLIALYVKTDESVQQIFVDGHSDNVGRRLLNRDLSMRRAEEVTRYLVSLGIDEEMIVTRYHGDRYPVVPNNTAENRTRNRRVTIRLERE